jgi:nitrite reductase/ring-hydroxylating ferredoxin subunit
MDREIEISLLKRAFEVIDGNTTDCAPQERYIPTAQYFDPEQAKIELQILAKTPVIVAHCSELAQPGDFVTLDVMGTPVVVVRQDDGSVKAMINVCRHRGARVVEEECGSKRLFSCRYHGWTYQRDGRLRLVPFAQGFEGIDRADFPLVELPAVERHGLIWALMSPGGSIDMVEYLGADLDHELADIGVETHALYRAQTFTVKCNWKVVLDGFTEVYHLATLHPDTIARTMLPNLLIVDEMGPHSRAVSPRRDIVDLRELPVEDWHIHPKSIFTYQLFPITIFSSVWNHREVWTVLPDPSDVRLCTVTARFLLPEPITTEKSQNYWDRNWEQAMRVVEQEDWVMGSNIQAGLEQAHIPELLAGRNEPVTQAFHRYIDEAVDIVKSTGSYEPAWIKR